MCGFPLATKLNMPHGILHIPMLRHCTQKMIQKSRSPGPTATAWLPLLYDLSLEMKKMFHCCMICL